MCGAGSGARPTCMQKHSNTQIQFLLTVMDCNGCMSVKQKHRMPWLVPVEPKIPLPSQQLYQSGNAPHTRHLKMSAWLCEIATLNNN